MKIYNYIILASAITLGLSSCNKDDCYKNVLPEDNVIRVNAGVSSMMVKSEIDETSLTMVTSDLSEFGLFVENAADSHYSYNNVSVTKTTDETTSTSAWTPSKQMLWKSATDPVTVYAYSPYNSQNNSLTDEINLSVCTDQTVAENVKASDFLYSSSEVTPSAEQETTNPVYYNQTDSLIKLKIRHKFFKLTVSVTLDTQFNDSPGTTTNPISSIKVTGTNVNAKFSFKNGYGELTNNTPVTACNYFYAAPESGNLNATAKYECILIPQTIASGGFSIKINMGENCYIWTSNEAKTFEGGNQYNMPLTIVGNRVKTSGMTAISWNEVTEEDVITIN